MAIDHHLLLQTGLSPIEQASNRLLQGLQLQQGLLQAQQQQQLAPLRQQLLEQQVQQGQAASDQAQRSVKQQATLYGMQRLRGLKTPEERFRAASQVEQEVQNLFGQELFDESGADINQLSDSFLDSSIRALQGGDQFATAEERAFKGLTAGLPQSDIDRARRIRLGLEARAGSSKEERLARDPELAQQVADSQSLIKGAVEEEKVIAKARGENFNELRAAEAALPGIRQVVDQLKVLADDATFTLSGKAFNEVSKQFGFAASGDTARSSMIAIVDNQVLPLLRPIFGAAFTKAEGDSLKRALVDPDSTPESRKAQLDAFFTQMIRNIETKQRIEGGQQDGVQETEEAQEAEGQVRFQEGQTAVNPTTGERIIFRNGQWQPAP